MTPEPSARVRTPRQWLTVTAVLVVTAIVLVLRWQHLAGEAPVATKNLAAKALPSSTATVLSPPDTTPVEREAVAAPSLRICVRDSDGPVAAAAVKVCALDGSVEKEVETDASGVVDLLPRSAQWLLVVDHANHLTLRQTFAASARSVDVVLRAGASLAGRVVTRAGDPVADALVVVCNRPPTLSPVTARRFAEVLHDRLSYERHARTTADGSFAVDGLELAPHYVIVHKPGYLLRAQPSPSCMPYLVFSPGSHAEIVLDRLVFAAVRVARDAAGLLPYGGISTRRSVSPIPGLFDPLIAAFKQSVLKAERAGRESWTYSLGFEPRSGDAPSPCRFTFLDARGSVLEEASVPYSVLDGSPPTAESVRLAKRLFRPETVTVFVESHVEVRAQHADFRLFPVSSKRVADGLFQFEVPRGRTRIFPATQLPGERLERWIDSATEQHVVVTEWPLPVAVKIVAPRRRVGWHIRVREGESGRGVTRLPLEYAISAGFQLLSGVYEVSLYDSENAPLAMRRVEVPAAAKQIEIRF